MNKGVPFQFHQTGVYFIKNGRMYRVPRRFQTLQARKAGIDYKIADGYMATPGAAKTINEWISCGHEVSIITGRPSSVYEPSRIWLDEHGLKNARLYCLNKYGRDYFIKNSNSTLELEDYYRMKFDYAVEDSPKAFRFFEHLPELKVLVFDRPWNRECAFPNGNYQRGTDWESIRKIVAGE